MFAVQIFFVFSSPLNPESTPELGQDLNAHIAKHGDAVKDVAFAVDDARSMFAEAVARGGVVVREPTEETDEHGTVVYATVQAYGDTVHTFVQRNGYKVRGLLLYVHGASSTGFPLRALLPARLLLAGR